MADPIPIRSDIEPTVDVEREMVDYCRDRLAAYCKKHGTPPATIAIALVGSNHAEAVSEAYSWSPKDENLSRLHACSTAAALLFKRALGL